MEILEFTNGEDFWQECAPYLKRREAANGLCLGLSLAHSKNGKVLEYQSCVKRGGSVVGVLVVSRFEKNLNVIPGQMDDEVAATALFERLATKNFKLNTLISEKNTADFYLKKFQEKGFKSKVLMSQGLYRCRKVIVPESQAELSFRKAQVGDMPLIAQWMQQFHDEAVPHDPAFDMEKVATQKIEKEMIYIVEKQREPVSMVAWARDIGSSCCVNQVYTPPEYRKQGLGSYGTACLTELLLGQGKAETNLYTDMSNSTSNKIYQNIGYELVCDSVQYGLIYPEMD